MKISKHISYKEGTHSNTATRNNIENIPDSYELEAMKKVAEMVFEPLRAEFGEPIRINSFFRSIELNKRIGGSSTSQHCKGEAIDMDALNGITNKQLFNYIKNNLDFDQLIDEQNYSWIHVSYKFQGVNRKNVLKMIDGKYYNI
tara:strand:+ start:10899 stop:11330 length:432 start_codon:yes stop_codon:yes gene_type:complete